MPHQRPRSNSHHPTTPTDNDNNNDKDNEDGHRWQPRSRSNTEFRDVTLQELDPVSLPKSKKTFISLPEICFHGQLRRLPKYDLGFENWTFEGEQDRGSGEGGSRGGRGGKPPKRISVAVEETEFQNDIKKWNIENMIRKELESIGSRRLCTNDVVFGGERCLLLPEHFKQYDKELLLRRRYVRRNGVQVYDKKGLVELLTLFISIKCMMMTSLWRHSYMSVLLFLLSSVELSLLIT